MNINRNYLLIAVIIIVGAGIYFVMFYKKVEVGDTVVFNYTAYLDTGEIFDTTFEEVALDDSQPKVWWFRLRAAYEPMTIVVGQGTLLPDLEMALIGMREGEKKDISIPPERAYGLRNPSKIVEIPLVQTLSKEDEVPIQEFVQRLGLEPKVDERYDLQGSTIHVVEMTSDKVRFVYELKQGQEIQIALGKATVTGETETEYEITLNPTLGSVIFSPYFGQGLVVEIKEDVMLADFNPILAGEILHYTLWVVKIEKP